jgi:hypothetical protein
MTVHQLPAPCWVITPRLPRDDGDPHYDDRAKALAVIHQAWDEDDWTPDAWWTKRLPGFRFRLSRLRLGVPRPRLLGTRCWAVQCDGECGTVIDEDDEGYVIHHKLPADAAETVAACEWVYSADGRLVFCADDAPEDGQEPPLTPAEQEAAGQLVIPGVLP